MCSLDSLILDFKGISAPETVWKFSLGDEFFEALGGPEVSGGQIEATVTARKVTSHFELIISAEGTAVVPCDVCLDDMEQPVSLEERLVVKFGDEFSDEDGIVTLDERDQTLDMSWYIYESVVLAIPTRHVHAPGKCNPAMMSVLEEHSAVRSSDGETPEETDPRWSALAALKADNNNN